MDWKMIKRDTTPVVLGIAMVINLIISVSIALWIGTELQRHNQSSTLAVIIGFIIFLVIGILLFWISSLILDGDKRTKKTANRTKNAVTRDIKQSEGSKSDDVITLQNDTSGVIKLIVYQQGKKVSEINAMVKESLIVGRSDLSDVYLEGKQLSRQHFALEFDGVDYYIEDLQTTNGTFLNGSLIQERCKLNVNDKIKVGSLEIVIRW